MLISMFKVLIYNWRRKAILSQAQCDKATLEAQALKRSFEEKEAEISRRQRLLNMRFKLNAKKIETDLQVYTLTTHVPKKPVVNDFDSGEWSGGEVGPTQSVKAQAEAYRLANGYKYMRILNTWNVATQDPKAFRKANKVVFSDQLIDVVDPTEEVLKLIVNEIKSLPQFLMHPNKDVRAVIEKVLSANELKQNA